MNKSGLTSRAPHLPGKKGRHRADIQGMPDYEAEPSTLRSLLRFFSLKAPHRIIEGGGQSSGTTLSRGTLAQYVQTQNKILEYLQRRRIADIPIASLNKEFYDDFLHFLMGKGLAKNTIGKHVKNIKAMIKILPSALTVNCEFVERGKCLKLEEEVNHTVLSEEELHLLHECSLDGTLDVIRDHFLMLCWTGCRYSDLGKLTRANMERLGDGWVFKFRQHKTGNKVAIPVFDEITPIMRKYHWQPYRPLSGVTFNRGLKEICRRAGIVARVSFQRTEGGRTVSHEAQKWRLITAHTARRTFATNMYKRGFPLLAIMKLTGHKSEKTFLKYIKIDEDQNALFIMKMAKESGIRSQPLKICFTT